MTTRKAFIQNISIASLAVMLAPINKVLAMSPAGKPKILIRSGGQTVNIGDIAHTTGILALLQKHIPDAELVLWLKTYDRGVEEMVRKKFPKLRIFKGKINEDPKTQKKLFEECDFFLHSSGPFVNYKNELKAWWETTKKPFGVYGVSLGEVDSELNELISHASFFYCRESESFKYFKTLENKCPVQGLAFDSTFGVDIYDDQKANAYLKSVGLNPGEFICVNSRLRYTPYWRMENREAWDTEKDREPISMAFKDRDAKIMRSIIISWVKATGLKVLICPEVTYQVDFHKETLYDPLPEDIKQHVVWRDRFWLPDEATSVYKNARAMVFCEPHSLIMAVANNIPSIHIKQSTDTRKGQMWRDIGLGDWYFLMDETPASQISHQLLEIHNNYDEAVTKVKKAMDYVRKVQKDTMQVVKNSVYLNK